jgi:hypothetical protein
MRRHAGGKASARRTTLHSLTLTPGIRIKGGFHKPTPIVRALGPHLFRALSCKATWMLQRRLRGTRFIKMSPSEREAHVLKIATEIANKVEARMIASGPCYHPEQLQALRLWDTLKRRAHDRSFLEIFGRTLQSAPNPILNKTEIVIVYLWACRFRFSGGEVVQFRRLSDERQRQIVSGIVGKKISLDGYRKARRRIGKGKAYNCVSLSDERARQIISGFLKTN